MPRGTEYIKVSESSSVYAKMFALIPKEVETKFVADPVLAEMAKKAPVRTAVIKEVPVKPLLGKRKQGRPVGDWSEKEAEFKSLVALFFSKKGIMTKMDLTENQYNYLRIRVKP